MNDGKQIPQKLIGIGGESRKIPGHFHETCSSSQKALSELWEKLMPGIVFRMPMAQRDHHTLHFLRSARKSGARVSDAFWFYDLKKNEFDRSAAKDCSKDQLPGLIFLSSTSESNLSAIFCQTDYSVEDGVARGGAFGTSTGMRKIRHVEDEASDFTAVMYMLNHLMAAELKAGQGMGPGFTIANDVAGYIPCMGDFDAGSEYSFEDVARVQIARLEKLASKARDANHVIYDGDGFRIWNFHGHQFALVPLVHDIETRKIYAAWQGEGGLKREEFRVFAGKRSLIANRISKMHMDNLQMHENNQAASEIIRMRMACKIIGCVDARCLNKNGSGAIKLIGAMLSGKEMERILANQYLERLQIRLHTHCGYVSTATRVHEMFEELMKAHAGGGARRREAGRILVDLERILKGEMSVIYHDSEKKAEMLGLLKSRKVFSMIFEGIHSESSGANLDFQRALKHMYDRGIIIGDAGSGFRVGAAECVAGFLAAKNVPPDASGEWFTYLVTEQMGRELANEIKNMKKRLKSGKKVEIVVESLEDRSIFMIPETLSLHDALNPEREMVVLGKNGEVELVRKPVFAGLKAQA